VKFSRKKKYDNMLSDNIILSADNIRFPYDTMLSVDNMISDDIMFSANNKLLDNKISYFFLENLTRLLSKATSCV
jgi:hypothetical protein